MDAGEAKRELAYALLLDIPVYPEDDTAQVALELLHASLFQDGVELVHSDGQKRRYVYRGERGIAFDPVTENMTFCPGESITPGDVLVALTPALRAAEKAREARRVLSTLRVAVENLDELLGSTKRNEGELQRCLTDHPLLFGLEYRRVIPKYRLGSNFELDYALERVSGLVDLVEIEASTHRLYTKGSRQV
jgi:hypothetical protein